LRRRMPNHLAIAIAIVSQPLLVWLSHLPPDYVTGDNDAPRRYEKLVGLGLLTTAVYLSIGNVMNAAALQAHLHGPMFIITGSHHETTTAVTNWVACIAVVLWYQRRLARSALPKRG